MYRNPHRQRGVNQNVGIPAATAVIQHPLTEARKCIKDPEGRIAAKGDVYLDVKEINDKTYVICKSDRMLKEHIR
ncbi:MULTISPECIES: hypothetical protein [unclassified Paracoccus (in: a-proteobacteria)]|uniref:hypothetical protein n=1 Tax=unclassified Paracoccus (in: a-proteobacteria) TaxID=2688777 RepID=UPI0012B3634D|nr:MULTISPECIES: hypothetical protein [unclassified Paracoccus (in: a-proteobacteria)]UXU76573.1 hypothetical protein GB879_014400 [Paracoccus sp. SMMA_5]UXU82459.1 hypothetical protein GB880_014035 [Paracoccus sp. SMMA_5_TC]